ncbi:isochorismatase family protein [Lactococcus termiticola]|uniref:Isochorismatase n=1 Tax=Lactococcus termiticola TaxID=2169526 RepID=A0A2R5HFB2_9LACT|nr:isochorismatase family protein [Lactococcus termiticola]GBG96763.1 isochorismatase [Lactococcus termiticola]
MDKLTLKKTALVIIDMQKGIASREGLAPYSAEELLAQNEKLTNSLLNTEALVVFVHVKNHGGEALKPITDAMIAPASQPAADFSDFIQESAYDQNNKNVIHVAKHNWGAFYGTDLDVQLRRRGIDTIILTGLATTIGVDTTAREAYQANYNVIAVEDAMTDFNPALHKAITEGIFKRLGRVRSTDEVLAMIKEAE